ncbi:MAG: RES family NAD+ phosphorylase [Ferruginibacter sp.]|nr:RES family NAD+ phosphorylase [Ferruginibacter sp.]
MIVYRICNALYSDDLSGNGSKLFGGRWNSKGVSMLYCSEHISLAVVEMLVHNQFKDFSVELSLLHITFPDTIEIKEVKHSKLKNNWVDDFGYTRFMGDQFIQSGSHSILKIPSAVITEENNYIINPLHADFKKIKISDTSSFRTDKRLFTI